MKYKCNGCDSEIVAIVAGTGPFVITVESPEGEIAKSYFCGSCITKIATAGAQILPVMPRDGTSGG